MAAADVASWTQGGLNSLPKVKKDHNLSPSKVIHCRAVADGCRETDLVQVLKVFGNIKALKLMPKISQGLVEFEELDSAIACVTYNRIQPILVHGRQMYVNYSKSSEISREFNISQGQVPTKILLLTVINVIHPINVETFKKICDQQNVEPQRIVIFHKNGLQAFVEFKTIEDASHIQQSLNSCDIYPGCCTLKIEFSKTEKLNVHSNTSESYNIDIRGGSCNTAQNSRYSDKNEKLSSEVSALLAGYQGLPAIQNIISRVLAMNESQNLNASGFKRSPKVVDFNTNGLSQHLSNNRTSLLQHSYKAQSQVNVLDQLIGPFAALGTGNNAVGGEGCVAMVYGINNENMNCDHLFNLFCLYGNVMKVKILVNKPGCAMVQYADRFSTELAIQHLSNIMLFGQQLQITFSKHPYIVESHQVSSVFDGTPSFVSYFESRNNRFRFVAGGKNDFVSRIHPPSKVLHYFNAPPDCTAERLEQIFESLKADTPIKQASISRPDGKSSSGLLEFSSISSAVEALMLINHVTLHKNESATDPGVLEKSGAPFTFKLAFSTSESVNIH